MQEVKRVFTSRRWIAAALLCLAANLLFYCQAQRTRVQGPAASYAAATNQWQETLASLDSLEAGIALTEDQLTALKAWDAAEFLARLDPGRLEEILPIYQEQYPGIEASVQALRTGKAEKPDTSQKTALSRWQERLTYQLHYKENIDRIAEQAAAIQGNPVFSKPGTFVFRNAGKTAKDFCSIQDITPALFAGDVVTSVVEYEAGTLIHIVFLFFTVLSLLHPIHKGVEPLLYTTPDGRGVLAFWRVLILGVSAIACVLAATGGQLLLGCLLYRQPVGWSLPAQSLSILQNWAVPGTVLGFLCWFALVQMLGLSVTGLALWLILSRCKLQPLGVLLCALFLAVEYWLFRRFQINDAGYWLASYNLFHLLSVKTVASRYLNYSFFGFPWSEKAAVTAVLLAGNAVLILLCLLPRRHKSRRRCLMPGFLKKRGQRKRRLPSFLLTLTGYEYKKLLLMAGGILFLLAGLFLVFRNGPDYLDQSQREALYSEYVDEYAGPVAEETLLAIQETEAQAEVEYEKWARSGDVQIAAYYEARCWALSTLAARYQDLLALKQCGLERIELVNENAYEKIYGEFGQGFRTRSALICLCTLCLTIPLTLGLEEKHHMKPVLFSAALGRTVLWRKKAAMALVLLVLVWMVWTGCDLRQYSREGDGLGSLWVHARSFSAYSACQENHVLFWYVAWSMLGRLCSLLTAGAVIWAVSSLCRQDLLSAGISLIALCGPFLLELLGVSLAAPVSCVAWLTREAQMDGLWSACVRCVLLVPALFVLSTRVWRGSLHIAFD